MTASQACADVMPNPAWLSSKAAASMLAIVHPWRKAARVGDLKAGPQASFGRLVPGPLDGAPGDVDAHRVGAVRGGQQSLLPRAAAGIKHPPKRSERRHAGRAGPASAAMTPASCGAWLSFRYSGPGRSRVPATIAPKRKMPAIHQNAVS